MTDYRPISCDFHDELLVRAMRGVPCEIVYLDARGAPCRDHYVIKDVYSRDGEEFLRLRSGAEIRLDRVIRVDKVGATSQKLGGL